MLTYSLYLHNNKILCDQIGEVSNNVFDKKTDTISNNVDCLHKLDIFLWLYIFKESNMSYNIDGMRKK